MDKNIMARDEAYKNAASKFITRVYAWMGIALLISGITALFTAVSPAMISLIFGHRFVLTGLLIAELVLVFVLSAAIEKISPAKAFFFFILYSVVNGMSLSAIFMIYDVASICIIFFVSAAMFFGMTLYGRFTKQDLTSVGRYLVMAIIGLILASLINFLLKSSLLEWIVSLISIVVFIGLTAYDTQKIMRIADMSDDSDVFKKAAIIGALELYLDFINIFLSLLRLFGRKRN